MSVPFSDHCTPLVDGEKEFHCLLSCLQEEVDNGSEKYLEIRSVAGGDKIPAGLSVSATFCLHRLDLCPDLDQLFHAFHDSCIRRKIASAQRRGVTYKDGRSEELLQKFYQLAVLTRRRQRIPPQPLSWFRNLIACMGESAKIRLAAYEGQPAAAILTIVSKATMTYKYGCSNPLFHKLGCMQLLLWGAIQEAKQNGLREFDMGRTDWTNEGLLTFKDRWHAARSGLVYLRHPVPDVQHPAESLPMRLAKRIVASAPDWFLTTAGSILYRHIA